MEMANGIRARPLAARGLTPIPSLTRNWTHSLSPPNIAIACEIAPDMRTHASESQSMYV